LDAMFEIPGSEIVSVEVTEDAVNGKSPPIYHYAQNATASENQQAASDEAPGERAVAAE